jgi:hypothetical protein
MQNAKDMGDDAKPPTFLLCGYPGGGKSIQAWTLPGRKFGYVFDPNTLPTWRGLDIDYEVYLPEPGDKSLSAVPLSNKARADRPIRKKEPLTYKKWENDFDTKDEKRFFANYDWIVFDSFTGFLDIIMDRVLFLNGRLGKQPEQADWGAQVNIVTNVARTLAAYEVGLMATAHLEFKQNDVSKKLFHHTAVTGKLRTRLPQVFSNVWICHADQEDGKRVWDFQTAADKEYPVVRSQWDLPTIMDATIYDFKDPTEYGLGYILKQHGWGKPRARVSTQKNVIPISAKRKV